METLAAADLGWVQTKYFKVFFFWTQVEFGQKDPAQSHF